MPLDVPTEPSFAFGIGTVIVIVLVVALIAWAVVRLFRK